MASGALKRKMSALRKEWVSNGQKCWYTGWVLKDLESVSIEHLVPRAQGGKWDAENLVACHTQINNLLQDLPLWEKLDLRKKIRNNPNRSPKKLILQHQKSLTYFGAQIWSKGNVYSYNKNTSYAKKAKNKLNRSLVFWKHAMYMGEHRKRMLEIKHSKVVSI